MTNFLVVIEKDSNYDSPWSVFWHEADTAEEVADYLADDGSLGPDDKLMLIAADHVRQFTTESRTVVIETRAVDVKH